MNKKQEKCKNIKTLKFFIHNKQTIPYLLLLGGESIYFILI